MWVYVSVHVRRGQARTLSALLCQALSFFFEARSLPAPGAHTFSDTLKASKFQQCSCLCPPRSLGGMHGRDIDLFPGCWDLSSGPQDCTASTCNRWPMSPPPGMESPGTQTAWVWIFLWGVLKLLTISWDKIHTFSETQTRIKSYPFFW